MISHMHVICCIGLHPEFRNVSITVNDVLLFLFHLFLFFLLFLLLLLHFLFLFLFLLLLLLRLQFAALRMTAPVTCD